MPLYEYVCQKCGRKTEIIQRHSDKPLTHCPNCGGKVKKAFSAPAIQFKGSGFYLTDYGRSGAGSRSEKGGAPEGGSEKAAEKASEKAAEKPAEKTDKKPAASKPEKKSASKKD